MTGTVPLARRNLLRQRLRFVLSVGGVGMALLLVLSLQAIYNAILDQVTAYPDNAGAPVIASQRGVETMHMSSSAIPLEVVRRLERDPRVERAAPILYVSVVLGEQRPVVSYLIGYRDGGGPWAMAKGSSRPRGDEIVLDEQTADRLGAGLGSRVTVLGRRLRVVGLARDTTSVLTTISFVDYATFARAAGLRDTASYVLIWPRSGLSAGDLAGRLQRDYPVTAQTRERVLRAGAAGHLRHEHGPDPRHDRDRVRRRPGGGRPQHVHGHHRPPARVRGAEGDRHAERAAVRPDLPAGVHDRGRRAGACAGSPVGARRRSCRASPTRRRSC